MTFLRSALIAEPHPALYGDSVWLRGPQMADFQAWTDLRAQSRDHLKPWEPAWSRDELTRWAFRRRLRHYHREMREAHGYSFFVFTAGGHQLVGGLTLSNLRRGVTQAATLGYWIGAPYAGRGLMTNAVGAIVPFVFDQLRLHRLEASTMQSNAASIRVLERCGFQCEGLARKSIRIDGAWQDHLFYALLSDDPRPPQPLAKPRPGGLS